MVSRRLALSEINNTSEPHANRDVTRWLSMTTFAPVSAPVPVQSPYEQQSQRAPVEYGAAVTHRDLMKEKLRVDPAAIAHKKRLAPEARSSDPARELPEHLGRNVDIEI